MSGTFLEIEDSGKIPGTQYRFLEEGNKGRAYRIGISLRKPSGGGSARNIPLRGAVRRAKV